MLAADEAPAIFKPNCKVVTGRIAEQPTTQERVEHRSTLCGSVQNVRVSRQCGYLHTVQLPVCICTLHSVSVCMYVKISRTADKWHSACLGLVRTFQRRIALHAQAITSSWCAQVL